MRNPIELNYIKKNGMLYPDLQISNYKDDDKQPIGKYGMMWLRFMQVWHYDRYIELQMSGELLAYAHGINNEAFSMIKVHAGNNCNIERAIIEDNIIRKFVLTIR